MHLAAAPRWGRGIKYVKHASAETKTRLVKLRRPTVPLSRAGRPAAELSALPAAPPRCRRLCQSCRGTLNGTLGIDVSRLWGEGMRMGQRTSGHLGVRAATCFLRQCTRQKVASRGGGRVLERS
eukprot:2767165-Pleurochrysis_carterae.AAC.6